MFILVTNVLSAMMRRIPPAPVAAWVAGQNFETLFTVAVCQAEIPSCLAILPTGRRRDSLQAAAQAMFTEDFEERILPFDHEAAAAYAELFAARRQAGRPIATLDLMIASIARTRGASIVTRDRDGFEGCGLVVIDPWMSA